MKSLEALERIQCNYVHVFKARENGKTQLVHDLNAIKKDLKVLEIIKKHLSITNAVEFNDKKEVKRTIELFDIDLWNDGKQEEDFEIVKEWLER